MTLFLTFKQLAQRSRHRPLALYGLGSVADATRRRCGRSVDWLIDSEAGLAGTTQGDVCIRDMDEVDQIRPLPFFVICSSDICASIAHLKRAGLKPHIDFAITPLLKEQLPVIRLWNAKGTLLLSSGAAQQNSPRGGGGGLYRLRFDAHQTRLNKLRSGPIYGIIRFGQHLLGIDPRLGIIQFDSEYREKLLVPLPVTAWCHGLAFDSTSQTFWVTATQLDQIMVFDINFQLIDTITLSNRREQTGQWGHHPNDLVIHGQSVFVSMFSQSGLWRTGAIDGAVVEIDLHSHAIRGPAITALHMPHNPTMIHGKLAVADSCRGRVVGADGQVIAKLPGYARGLAADDRYLYVGQSLNRAYSQLPRGPHLSSVDTSLQILDTASGLSRSLTLPSALTDIHTLLCLGSKSSEPS